MVTSIARQSIIIKCNQQASVLLGNYEFYYVAGLMKKLFDFPLSEDLTPSEMIQVIQEHRSTAQPKNEQEKYLLKMVEFFRPLDIYDDQTKELFRWGAQESHLWQINA